MRAIQIKQFGGPEVMELVELPDPVAKDGQLLLDITSIGVNYADTHQTENSYLSAQQLPLIPGMEVVGTHEGKRYLAMVSGGYAEKGVADSKGVIPLPDSITDEQALSLFVQGTTAWHILKTLGHVKPGESVVVHAAAGGVGTLAIQLAKLWGAYVIAVASSDEKRALALSLGADAAIDSNPENLHRRIREANNGKKVDIILEMVGGPTFDESLLALADFGRLITYGMASRTAPTPLQPGALMHGSKTISGFWLANCLGKKDLLVDVLSELFGLVINGSLKPVIGGTYSLADAQSAHKAMLIRSTTGKVVLKP